MADKNQLKVADVSDFGDDDPFAELTRIMGFDPRVPVQSRQDDRSSQASVEDVRQAEPAPAPRLVVPEEPVATQWGSAETAQPVDDFSIDLEREMLGSSLEPEPYVIAPSAQTLEFSPEQQSSVRYLEPVAPEPIEPETSVDDDIVDDFDLDLSADLGEELALDRDNTVDHVETVQASWQQPASYAVEPEQAYQPERAYKAEQSYETERAHSEGRANQAEEVYQAEKTDLDFDIGMAEIDMDFGGAEETAPSAGSGSRGEPMDDSFIDDFEAEFEANDLAWSAPDAAPQNSSGELVEEGEISLEDELQALLGNPVAPAVLTSDYDHSPLSAAQPFAAEADENDIWQEFEQSFATQSAPADEYREETKVYAADPAPRSFDNRFAQGNERPVEQGDEPLLEAPILEAPILEDPILEDPILEDLDFDAAFENSLAAAAPAAAAYAVAGRQSTYAEPAPRTSAPYQPVAAAPASVAHRAAGDRQVASPTLSARPGAPTAPDIETVDVHEAAVAFADDLDLPELKYQEDKPAASASAYDEFDAEFSNAFNDVAQEEQPSRAAQPAASSRYEDLYAAPAQSAAPVSYASTQTAFVDDGRNANHQSAAHAGLRDEDFDLPDYDEQLDQAIAIPAYQPAEPVRARPNRGLMIAAVAGGVAILGAIGAFALSFGDSGSDVPAVVRADGEPVKVRPENPGGTAVPNQTNKVFDTMAGTGNAGAPAQEKLITSTEEPVDMAARATPPAAAEPAAKGEDRIDPASTDAETSADSMEVAAVAPRKVKTMVVRSDGTLVPREEPTPAIAQEPQQAASAPVDQPSALAPAVTDENAAGQPESAPVANAPASTADTPSAVPVAPQRPAEQPVEVVGEVKPDQVAAVSGAAGAYSMQIASQPTEAGAQETYQDLARKYANIIGGKPASIVKAEIPGKGTFWRVRISADSRNEAISLCESYKSAGGNCFVSK